MSGWIERVRGIVSKPQPQPTPVSQLSGYEASWPFAPDSPAIQSVVNSSKKLSVMLVDLTGLNWPEIEPLLPVAQNAATARGMAPVLIVDLVDYAGLRQTDFAYDVLPNAGTHVSINSDLDWPAYIAKRRALLTEKWKPDAIVHLSQKAEGWT